LKFTLQHRNIALKQAILRFVLSFTENDEQKKYHVGYTILGTSCLLMNFSILAELAEGIRSF